MKTILVSLGLLASLQAGSIFCQTHKYARSVKPLLGITPCLVAIGSADALTDLPAFKAFRDGIRDRCEIQPMTVGLKETGSYRFFNE